MTQKEETMIQIQDKNFKHHFFSLSFQALGAL